MVNSEFASITLTINFHISKIFVSITTWPVTDKFDVEPTWVRGRRVCSKNLGRMTIYGKNSSHIFSTMIKVKSAQRSGTEAIRTQIQPSKPKREIINITYNKIQREHMVNRVGSYIPKGSHSATETELK